jgi:hypothetical protein
VSDNTDDAPELLVEQFDHIPQLQELMRNAGRPGLEYAQICTHHLLKAQTDIHPTKGGWLMVNRPAYVIEGPKGKAEMVLMTRGQEITSPSASAGARKCVVDTDIEKLTGHSVTKKEQAGAEESKPAGGPAPKVQDKEAGRVSA